MQIAWIDMCSVLELIDEVYKSQWMEVEAICKEIAEWFGDAGFVSELWGIEGKIESWGFEQFIKCIEDLL